MLYHLSENPYLTKLTPRLPDGAIPGAEEMETPRVSFSTSINGCLLAICGYVYRYTNNISEYTRDLSNPRIINEAYDDHYRALERVLPVFNRTLEDYDTINFTSIVETGAAKIPYYYVYVPATPCMDLQIPDVYDQKLTGEVWCLNEVDVIRVGAVIVTGAAPIGKDYHRIFTAKNGKKIRVPVLAYEYQVTPRDFIFKADRYMNGEFGICKPRYKSETNIPKEDKGEEKTAGE